MSCCMASALRMGAKDEMHYVLLMMSNGHALHCDLHPPTSGGK